MTTRFLSPGFKVSVICTVLNEGQSIKTLLDSLAAQTRPPDEVILVDGGSTDETLPILKAERRLPLLIIEAPGANISRGRNLAITAASGPIIASTDAGVRLDGQWLERLMAPFERDPVPTVVSGFFVPDPQSAFEVAMGATVLPVVLDIEPEKFLPSSRSVAFLKSAWEAVGGYPEWLDFCEDLIFDFRLRDKYGSFLFEPEAVAFFRPRSSLTGFFKQYYRYARGDGKADLYRLRHAIRYGTYLIALPLLLLGGWRLSRWWWVAGLGVGAVGMFRTPYRRLCGAWRHLSPLEKLEAVGWVPIIRLTGDVAKMFGYPAGLGWRLAHLSSRSELRWRKS